MRRVGANIPTGASLKPQHPLRSQVFRSAETESRSVRFRTHQRLRFRSDIKGSRAGRIKGAHFVNVVVVAVSAVIKLDLVVFGTEVILVDFSCGIGNVDQGRTSTGVCECV